MLVLYNDLVQSYMFTRRIDIQNSDLTTACKYTMAVAATLYLILLYIN